MVGFLAEEGTKGYDNRVPIAVYDSGNPWLRAAFSLHWSGAVDSCERQQNPSQVVHFPLARCARESEVALERLITTALLKGFGQDRGKRRAAVDFKIRLRPGAEALNILLASSEVVPFAKTGGLADVCGALPIELSKLGHQVTVVLPAYRAAKQCGQKITDTGVTLEIPIGSNLVEGRILRSQLPHSDVPVLLIDQPDYFDRAELYREQGRDYKDNCERFVFFCRSAMESIRLLGLSVDLIHANDWQTGLLPALHKAEYENAPGYEHIATLLTIHNMAYQGRFWHWDMLLTGLDWKYFNWRQMEYYGDLNLLKTGIVFADSINTVSPQYAQEIQTPQLGCGLEGVLSHRRHVLSGILNGVDYQVWNPSTDDALPVKYSSDDWQVGKAACKAKLQRELGLPVSADAPLIGIVGRLADQKGFDLIAQVIRQWVVSSDAQWAILGTGEPQYHTLCRELSGEFPGKVKARLEFSDPLARRIEAGSDIFLMPSRYEPCGLNQLYSLKYGTVPVVHRTGGLADTITDATSENVARGTANGFVFDRYESSALDHALGQACDAYRHDKQLWKQLVTTGMTQDWSWAKSAREYVELYEATIERANQLCA